MPIERTAGGGGGSTLTVTDGTHSVSPVSTLDFTSNATVSNAGGGQANVAVSAGLVKLFDQTLGVAAASIDTGANGIAAGHAHLKVEAMGRSDAATNIVDFIIRFNGDNGNNYDDAWLRNSGGTVSAVDDHAQPAAHIGQMPAATATASYVGSIGFDIPSYDQTSFFKSGFTLGSPAMDLTANDRIIFSSFTWRSTVAINQITILPSTGNFLAGSRLTVYGTQ